MTRRTLTVLALLAAMLVPTPAAADPLEVLTVGTSIEAGIGVESGESWPQRLDLRTPASITDMSLGGGAYTASFPDGDNIRRHVDAAIELGPDVIVLGGPVNDLVRLTDVGPLREAVFDAGNAVRAAGIRLVVMAIFPFNDGGAFEPGWWPNLEERRGAYNSWCAAMYGPDCVGTDWPLHETTTWRADARWFRDGLHPNRVGAALIGEVFPLERLEAS